MNTVMTENKYGCDYSEYYKAQRELDKVAQIRATLPEIINKHDYTDLRYEYNELFNIKHEQEPTTKYRYDYTISVNNCGVITQLASNTLYINTTDARDAYIVLTHIFGRDLCEITDDDDHPYDMYDLDCMTEGFLSAPVTLKISGKLQRNDEVNNK